MKTAKGMLQAKKVPVMIAITRVILIVVARLKREWCNNSHLASLSPSYLTWQPAGRRLLTVKFFFKPLLQHLDQDGQPDQEDQDKGGEEGYSWHPPAQEFLKHLSLREKRVQCLRHQIPDTGRSTRPWASCGEPRKEDCRWRQPRKRGEEKQ